MREKYIEEDFKRYFTHGEHDDGRVDLCDVNQIIATVTPAEAAKIIQDRNDVINKLIKTCLRFSDVNNEEFTKIWYGC